MELRHAPIPSLKGWWGGVRRLISAPKPTPAPRGPLRPTLRRLPAAPQRRAQWGAADCPELLPGECEPHCALLPLLEDLQA